MTDNKLILKSFPAMGAIEAFENFQMKNNLMLLLMQKELPYMDFPEQSVFKTFNYTGGQSLDMANIAFRDLWYLDDEDGRKTRSYQGVIMASEKILSAVRELNMAKDALHMAIKYLTGENRSALSDIKAQIKDNYTHRQKLDHLRISRLNLNACYRHVPLLDDVPIKIGYSLMCRGKSIKKITPEQAIAKLEKLNKECPPHIQIQIKKLKSLSPGTVMALIQKQAPILKANIVFLDKTQEPYKRYTLTRKPPLPIFMPVGIAPTVNFINTEFRSNSRLERQDRSIEDEAFIPSLRIHKYIEQL